MFLKNIFQNLTFWNIFVFFLFTCMLGIMQLFYLMKWSVGKGFCFEKLENTEIFLLRITTLFIISGEKMFRYLQNSVIRLVAHRWSNLLSQNCSGRKVYEEYNIVLKNFTCIELILATVAFWAKHSCKREIAK